MKKIEAIDINMDEDGIESGGIAYYRIPKQMKEFLSLCDKKHGIMGFEFEVGSFNFGIILRKKNDE